MPLKHLVRTLATLAILALLFLPASSPAQDGYRISGAVVAAESATPLAGVSVTAKGANASTRTKGNGRFSLVISTPGPVTLVFSMKGYRSVKESVDSSTSAVIISMKKQ